jgi:TPR repeat protein
MAALQNVPEAQFNFALMQAEGVGMPKNEEEAFLMFKKAAVKGLAQAQYNVGIFLAEGRGTAGARVNQVASSGGGKGSYLSQGVYGRPVAPR